jgi:hypothetical protein
MTTLSNLVSEGSAGHSGAINPLKVPHFFHYMKNMMKCQQINCFPIACARKLCSKSQAILFFLLVSILIIKALALASSMM